MKNRLAMIITSIPIAAMAADTPVLEFAFEERVTIDPAVVLGNTDLGHRQFIAITGGTVTGPKLKGKVLPGGFDYQLTYSASDCTQLSADYFLKTDDGTVIRVLNEGLSCPGEPRAIFRPKLEATPILPGTRVRDTRTSRNPLESPGPTCPDTPCRRTHP